MQQATKKVIELNSTDQGREELKQLYKNVFGSGAGEIVLEDLKQRCYFNSSTSYRKDGTIALPHEALFLEGMRNVVLLIQDNLEHEPIEKKGNTE